MTLPHFEAILISTYHGQPFRSFTDDTTAQNCIWEVGTQSLNQYFQKKSSLGNKKLWLGRNPNVNGNHRLTDDIYSLAEAYDRYDLMETSIQ